MVAGDWHQMAAAQAKAKQAVAAASTAGGVDARRTARNNALLDCGTHPATLRPLAGNGETCGTCRHIVRIQWRSRTYLKCEEAGITHGPGTDIRAKWPACRSWEPQK